MGHTFERNFWKSIKEFSKKSNQPNLYKFGFRRIRKVKCNHCDNFIEFNKVKHENNFYWQGQCGKCNAYYCFLIK